MAPCIHACPLQFILNQQPEQPIKMCVIVNHGHSSAQTLQWLPKSLPRPVRPRWSVFSIPASLSDFFAYCLPFTLLCSGHSGLLTSPQCLSPSNIFYLIYFLILYNVSIIKAGTFVCFILYLKFRKCMTNNILAKWISPVCGLGN